MLILPILLCINNTVKVIYEVNNPNKQNYDIEINVHAIL